MSLLKRIEELEKLAEKATPGPWEPCIGSGHCEMTALSHQEQEGPGTEFVCDLLPDWAVHQSPRKAENMEFIAASRTAIPELYGALREAIEVINLYNSVNMDNGGTARAFLIKHGLME